MNEAYLLIGGNLGNRSKNLEKARILTGERIGPIVRASSVYETEAWGITDQPDFYNQVLLVTTELQPEPLMRALLGIENEMGRIRRERYGPRIIDIDLLLYNDLVYNSNIVSIPHPRIPERRFVLEPLHEIAPDKMHPLLHQSVSRLLEACPDTSFVKKQ
ncbi:2-amino-4-hydroxy-6-hydroxymethyldihydropteridine diphosphokinase [Niabella ginsenosidivorans]|uniref:2-amino-4-hydroxy-6-hydroxymethyldihydropteridine pyrophosphokinase n=1 Tax=Niabella ginsenosidivorans TaxID=1176587 RepID=A0A1A9HY15_9BACT|nr:2-amino-4-hydroxy-6-hydroxymethyldihydropteridine diphosphokinase [Niabella ginsenosidivorans]ANH80143.1 2-amino-4-hydroxy-6-hydroxymethyldihydropteridine diphosphokinase [Niabella ginsenosidivorans]